MTAAKKETYLSMVKAATREKTNPLHRSDSVAIKSLEWTIAIDGYGIGGEAVDAADLVETRGLYPRSKYRETRYNELKSEYTRDGVVPNEHWERLMEQLAHLAAAAIAMALETTWGSETASTVFNKHQGLCFVYNGIIDHLDRDFVMKIKRKKEEDKKNGDKKEDYALTEWQRIAALDEARFPARTRGTIEVLQKKHIREMSA